MTPVGQPARGREMAARDAVKCVPKITRNHCPTSAKCAVIDRKACTEQLGRIEIPVGIGVGDEDVATVPAKSESLHAAIKGSELQVFKGTGHSSSIEAPDQVNDLIARTIRR